MDQEAFSTHHGADIRVLQASLADLRVRIDAMGPRVDDMVKKLSGPSAQREGHRPR